MKRVLFVDHVSRILGGAELNLIELVAAAVPRGRWVMACACASGSPLSQALSALPIPQLEHGFSPALNTLRVVERRGSVKALRRSLLGLRDARRQLLARIRAFRPQVVVSCTNKDHFCAGYACQRAGVPSIWWVNDVMSREFFSWPLRAAFRWQARRAAHLTPVSDYAGDALRRAGIPPGRMTRIHNGLPLSRYQPQPRGFLRRHLSIAPDQPMIGLVGRVAPWKGQRFFLELARAWAKEGQAGHFIVIGKVFNEDQAFERDLRQWVETQGLAGRVHFASFQENLVAALSDLDVMVHASLRPEPFGRVIIEAMAVGAPVIAARAGGVPEIIEDRQNGWLAAPGDLREYLTALRQRFQDEELTRKIREAAGRVVRERFTIERVLDQFEAIIDRRSEGGAAAVSSQSTCILSF